MNQRFLGLAAWLVSASVLTLQGCALNVNEQFAAETGAPDEPSNNADASKDNGSSALDTSDATDPDAPDLSVQDAVDGNPDGSDAGFYDVSDGDVAERSNPGRDREAGSGCATPGDEPCDASTDAAPDGNGDAESGARSWRVYDLATDLRSYGGCDDGATRWCLAMATNISEAGASMILSDPAPLNVVGPWSTDLPWIKAWKSSLQDAPLFLLNTSSDPALIANAILMLPEAAACHPGPRGEYAVAIWKSPDAGTVQYDVTFTGIDIETGPNTVGTTTDVHVLVKGQEVFGEQLVGGLTNRKYSGTSDTKAGDPIAFAVGYGANRAFESDATGLRATVRFSGQPEGGQ